MDFRLPGILPLSYPYALISTQLSEEPVYFGLSTEGAVQSLQRKCGSDTHVQLGKWNETSGRVSQVLVRGEVFLSSGSLIVDGKG